MKTVSDWRSALAALGLAVTAVLCAAPLSAGTADPASFVAPSEPMRLTRVLERELADGNAVAVTRSWRVLFVAEAAGYKVTGEEIAVEVDVPPKLAPLAEVERNNRHEGTFPIVLDSAGLITPRQAPGQAEISGLAEAAGAVLQHAPEDRRASAMEYVLAVQLAGARVTSRWPEDLFFPVASPRSEERVLPLPDGGSGRLTVHFEGTLDPAGRHLARAERRIETAVGGSTRTSRETWLLEPF